MLPLFLLSVEPNLPLAFDPDEVLFQLLLGYLVSLQFFLEGPDYFTMLSLKVRGECGLEILVLFPFLEVSLFQPFLLHFVIVLELNKRELGSLLLLLDSLGVFHLELLDFGFEREFGPVILLFCPSEPLRLFPDPALIALGELFEPFGAVFKFETLFPKLRFEAIVGLFRVEEFLGFFPELLVEPFEMDRAFRVLGLVSESTLVKDGVDSVDFVVLVLKHSQVAAVLLLQLRDLLFFFGALLPHELYFLIQKGHLPVHFEPVHLQVQLLLREVCLHFLHAQVPSLFFALEGLSQLFYLLLLRLNYLLPI